MNHSAIFTPLLIAALLFFVWSCYRRFSLVALGRPEERFDRIGERIAAMLRYAFGQQRVVARPFGINHFIIFWAFIILLIANGEFLLSGVVPGVTLRLLPTAISGPLVFLFDLVSLLALVCVLLAVGRRLFFKPDYLDSAYVKARSFEGFLILAFIGLLMVAYFGLHAVEICLGAEPLASFMPVSNFAASLVSCGGTGAGCLRCGIAPWGEFFWWLHAGVLLAFIVFLPLSKHMHILTAIPNCFLKSLETPLVPPREEFAKGKSFGVYRVDEFTWKDLFDGFSCTECGRCQDACPATATGKPLNPRQVIHAIKTNLLANADDIKAGRPAQVPLVNSEGEGTNTEDTIWSCTTCGACLQACPVFIEQLPKIIQMRRYLVEMEAKFPEELLNLFENMEGRSNPWGIAPTERTKWCSTMEVKPFEAGKTEYLFYVGCAGSFDSRQKHVTVALATLLDAAGVSWGILGKEEKCCGDSLRRLGNEFVFDRMAKENVQLFKERGVTKIIAQCPHCFTTLKNDYRQYGLELEVVHHSQLLEQLISSGQLKLPKQVTGLGNILLHDSCYLGRHNGVLEAPRNVLRQATGSAPTEFGRNRENGFCCGAGGGRMWLEEHLGTRININRVDEALKSNPDTVCVACPYCLTMFEDGLKDRLAGQTKVRDVAEVVAEALRP